MRLVIRTDDGDELETMGDIEDTLDTLGLKEFGDKVANWVERVIRENTHD